VRDEVELESNKCAITVTPTPWNHLDAHGGGGIPGGGVTPAGAGRSQEVAPLGET